MDPDDSQSQTDETLFVANFNERFFDIPQFDVRVRRRELVQQIENLVVQVVGAISRGEKPSFRYDDGRDSGWSSCSSGQQSSCGGNSDFPTNSSDSKKLKYTGTKSKQRFAVVMRVLSHAHANLVKYLENKDGIEEDEFYCTKRAFFYSLKNEDCKRFVKKQERVEWAINEATLLLDCGPWDLGFISTSKGLVSGDLSLHFGESRVINYEASTSLAVPDVVPNVTRIRTTAEYVLVVEKDSVFQKLLREQCPAFNRCILITGKGYPDIATRMLVNLLSEKAQLPVYALVDHNPHGFEIMCVYRFGTLNNLGYREQLLCPSMRWIGVHQKDLIELNIPRIKMTKGDLKKIDDMKNRSYISDEFYNHLMESRSLGKAEIESINNPMKRFLTERFIPSKILNKDFL
ncbi:hypothetical protein QAD02_009824 [Eretmocerus hayati]|uniref:Uncharacterized protein n=1 Tax=Eretmocerus hayati TaxID=131215 RepID=A0ACC2NB74_9HYME|nr:hypothetical protein QAD02_009824 [Eretmocerus hayati]